MLDVSAANQHIHIWKVPTGAFKAKRGLATPPPTQFGGINSDTQLMKGQWKLPSWDFQELRGKAEPPPKTSQISNFHASKGRWGNQPHFGKGMGQWLNEFNSSPHGQVIFQDVIGFGVLRTTLDLFREYFYKKTENGKRELNIPAARERIIRETGCIFIANFMGGLLAYGAGEIANKLGYKNAVSRFASKETVEYFQHMNAVSASPDAFFQNIAKSISPEHADYIAAEIKQACTPGAKTIKGVSPFQKAAFNIVRKLDAKKDTLDVIVRKNAYNQHFVLDSLIEDTARVLSKAQQPAGSWQNGLKSVLNKTMSLNKFLIPAIMGITMALTILVPMWNIKLTKKVDNIKNYPGVKGLVAMEQVTQQDQKESWWKRTFPYLSKTLPQGNLIPFILSAIPMIFGIGITHNQNLGQGLWKAPGLKAGFLNLPGKGFVDRLFSMFHFTKQGTFTTVQQISTLCAVVSTVRIALSRDKIEFRERIMDSFYTTWTMWILGSPALMKLFARWSDKNYGTKLLKSTPEGIAMRVDNEIKHLLNPQTAAKTLKAYNRMHKIANWGTIILIGICEPMAAIKWSEYQIRKAQAKKTKLLEQNLPSANLHQVQ